jgi:hypothetical protein
MRIIKVGMRKFRQEFGQFVVAGTPVAITKYGRTIGLYIPIAGSAETADLEVEAGRALDVLIGRKRMYQKKR